MSIEAPVSVVMAVRDGARYIEAALLSVTGQTAVPSEIIVVDDGSQDDTAAVVERFGSAVRLLRQPPMGVAAATNRAVTAAGGEVLAFLDADDIWEPDALESRFRRLNRPDRPEAVGGRLVQFISPDMEPDVAKNYRFDPGPLQGALFGALMVEKGVMTRFGPLDEGVPFAPNVEWVARARAKGLRIEWIEDVVLQRRIHTGNLTVLKRDEHMRALLEVARRHRRWTGSPPSGY